MFTNCRAAGIPSDRPANVARAPNLSAIAPGEREAPATAPGRGGGGRITPPAPTPPGMNPTARAAKGTPNDFVATSSDRFSEAGSAIDPIALTVKLSVNSQTKR